jgi:hypothetical protein
MARALRVAAESHKGASKAECQALATRLRDDANKLAKAFGLPTR